MAGTRRGARPPHEVDDHLIIRALLKAGLGFSLLTRWAFRAGLPFGEPEAGKLWPRAFRELARMQGMGERHGAAAP
jgi:DNA-binding transcriptional LysR family regulator